MSIILNTNVHHFTHHAAELCEEDRYRWACEQEPHREGLLPLNELKLSAVGTLRGEGDPQTLHSQGICQKRMDIHGNHVVCVAGGTPEGESAAEGG